ncbi:hypothetical protein ACOBQX_23635 [Actinokineospora sp. G85]|uniref:hypothetical protein n=1 Tax=Actinokineospora sp. G85 TaxID=3406626 RepID=UPI003C7349CB
MESQNVLGQTQADWAAEVVRRTAAARCRWESLLAELAARLHAAGVPALPLFEAGSSWLGGAPRLRVAGAGWLVDGWLLHETARLFHAPEGPFTIPASPPGRYRAHSLTRAEYKSIRAAGGATGDAVLIDGRSRPRMAEAAPGHRAHADPATGWVHWADSAFALDRDNTVLVATGAGHVPFGEHVLRVLG